MPNQPVPIKDLLLPSLRIIFLGREENISDSELENCIDVSEWLSRRFACLVVFGLIIEVLIAFQLFDGYQCIKRFAPLASSLCVAIGVAGEVLFATKAGRLEKTFRHRITEESNKKISELNNQARQAELKTEKLRAQLAPRALTLTQQDCLREIRGKVQTLLISPYGDMESISFATQIASVFASAGVDAKQIPSRLGLVGYGISILFPNSVINIEEHPLWIAFTSAKLPISVETRIRYPMPDLPADIPIIIGHQKPVLDHTR